MLKCNLSSLQTFSYDGATNNHQARHLTDISAIDLMEKMLEVDADKRITAAQTLSHPYLEEVSKVAAVQPAALI